MMSTFRCCSVLSKSHVLRQVYSGTVRGFASEEKLVDVSMNKNTDVATVTLQRLPVNGLNLELLQQISQTLTTLEKSECRGMILTSAAPTIFSAGLDIMEMYKPKAERVKMFWSTLQDVWLKLYGCSFPTVAAINGHSPAGGCLLALSCEYRIMSGPKFSIGLNETQLGIVAPRWFQDSMRNVIGIRQTELALTTGRMFKLDEALKVGLIDEIATDKDDCLKRAEAFLEGMSSIPPQARALTKKSVREDTLKWLVENKEKDLNQFLTFINLPITQQGLGLYMEMLKSKSKNK